MNVATKERRLAKAMLLLNRLKVSAVNGQLIFFSDEKNFSQEQKINIFKEQVAMLGHL